MNEAVWFFLLAFWLGLLISMLGQLRRPPWTLGEVLAVSLALVLLAVFGPWFLAALHGAP